MKKYLGSLGLIFLGFLILFITFEYTPQNRDKVKIDLPEEYMAISRDSTKPDTLLSYISHDTLHIYFKH